MRPHPPWSGALPAERCRLRRSPPIQRPHPARTIPTRPHTLAASRAAPAITGKAQPWPRSCAGERPWSARLPGPRKMLLHSARHPGRRQINNAVASAVPAILIPGRGAPPPDQTKTTGGVFTLQVFCLPIRRRGLVCRKYTRASVLAGHCVRMRRAALCCLTGYEATFAFCVKRLKRLTQNNSSDGAGSGQKKADPTCVKPYSSVRSARFPSTARQ